MLYSVARFVPLLVTLCILAACVTIEHGVRPDFAKLETLMPLQLGEIRPHAVLPQCGEADVVRALGEPSGKGMARFPEDPTRRPVWSYEFVRSNITQMNTRFILVFFRDGRCDGYMWFASEALVKGTP